MGSKLTYDIAGWGDGAIYDAVAVAGLKAAKVEMSLSEMNLNRLRTDCGVECFVFRPQYPGVEDPRFIEQLPVEDALAYIDELRSKPGWPMGMAWEFLCEPECKTAAQVDALADYYERALDGLHARGEHLAAFSFSTGNPTPERLQLLARPMIRRLLAKFQKGDLVALHEYSPNTGHALQVMRAMPLKVDYALTEFGFDIAGDPSHNWQDQHIPGDVYVDLLFEMVARYESDSRCKFAAIFNWGDIGVYRGFDVSTLGARISARVRALGGGAPLVWTMPAPWTPPDDPPGDTPIYELWADKGRVPPGGTVTISWRIEHVDKAYLIPGGENGITGPTGSMTFTPAQTQVYTLRVLLVGGGEDTKPVTVVVEAAPPEPPATEPADPILRAFPRPPNDNGLGMHFGLDCRQKDLDLHLPMLEALRVKWVVFYTPSPDAAVLCVRAALAHGMQPILRPKARIDEPFDFGAYARALPGHYIQIYNEWGNPREWRGRVPSDYVAVAAGRWRLAAIDVAEEGAYPGLQAMGAEEAFPALNGLPPTVAQRVWMASHAYPSNHPPSYPYDIGETVFQDDVTQLRFLLDAHWAQNALGFIPPVVVTEGGYQYLQLEDDRYPRIDDALHASLNAALFEQFRKGVLANGESLPDYLFAICPWLWSHPDWTSWYAGIDGTRQQTLDAVKLIPRFVRQFGGTAPEPPPPPPAPDTALEHAIENAEGAVAKVQSALIDQQAVAAYLRSLRR